jgi:cytochrome c peroxidase
MLPPLFTNNEFHNIGLDDQFAGFDQGRYNVTGNPVDMGKFKTPTLRNVALKNSFMHDGRFSTLEEVIEHYNSGVKHSSTLDPIMTKPGNVTDIDLTEQQKSDLIAFLKTLVDDDFIGNKDLGRP